MNMSKAISHIKMVLGLNAITLPFKDDNSFPVPTENIIREVLTTITIPIYSDYEPWIRKGDCDLKSLKCVDQRNGIYLLPAWLTMTDVKYVSDISLPMHNYRGTFGDISPAYGINRSAQGVVTSQAYMMLAGQMRAEPTFEYLGENKVKLYGYPRCMLSFSVACEHDPNGESIPESCYSSFMELAILDVKMYLYNNLKYYKEIPSAHGGAKLEIEDFQGAEAERNTLLEKWGDTFHVDMDWIDWM